MVKHLPIVAGLHAVLASIQLMTAIGIGLLFMLLGGGMGALGATTGEEEILIFGALYGTVGLVAGFFSGVMAIPGFLAAWGMYTRRPWGRILGMGVSVLALASIPIGTMVGIYTLVVLLDRDVGAAFNGEG